MREYIVNLTNNLIRKNRYDAHPLNRDFIGHVTNDLEFLDVKNMSPETLGKILCSLEIGDVMAGKQELFGALNFSGDCEETLRQFVALCLAYVIKERLDPHPASPSVVPYKSHRSPFQMEDSGFRAVIDGLSAKRNSSPSAGKPKFTFLGYKKKGFNEFVAVFQAEAGNEFYNTKHQCEQRKGSCGLTREVLATWPKK